ncbi:MAG: hypothetical protein GY856_44040 [bacterium]|nr:hypothetical protein [bacterium]
MSLRATDASLDSDALGFQGEGEWLRLRRQIELAEGFWLGFLFTPSPAVGAVLANRTEVLLRARARSFRRIRPDSPAALRAALGELFDETSEAGCVWLEAIKADSPGRHGESPGPWTAAWDDLLLRLNERRERIRRHLGGGLVLVAPSGIKGRARNAAPDLWSIHDLVLEPQPQAPQRQTAVPRKELGSEARSRAVAPVDRSAFEPTYDGRRGQAGAGVDAMELLREAEGLLLREEARKAIPPAALAVERLERADAGANEDDRLAAALATLARAEAADGDVAAAIEHIRRAVELREEKPSKRSTLLWLELWGELATEAVGDLAQAGRAYESMVIVSRQLLERDGETPQALRDLSVSLDKLGGVRELAADPAGASAAYEESLEIRRRILASYGETPQALRDLSVSLNKLGGVRELAADPAGASAAYEESLAIRRRILASYGETPQALRDLAFSLQKVADLNKQLGDGPGSEELLQELSAIRKQLAGPSYSFQEREFP